MLSPEEKVRRKEERKKLRWLSTHKIENDIIYKWCKHGEHWVEENDENFYKNNSSGADGYSPNCKKCDSKKSFQNQKDNWERTQKFKHDWHIKHRQRVIEKCRKWREDNLEWKQEYQRDYLQNNPDKVKKYNDRRRHKKHTIGRKEWKSCKEYFDDSCAYCGLPEEIHREEFNQDLHKEHVDNDGSNGLGNCIPSCGSCNYRKWEYGLDDWYNSNNPRFSQERYNKIMTWLNEDYKKFLKKKKSK